MIRFRTKYWFLICGGNVTLCLIGAAAHALTLTCFCMGMAFASWHLAHWFLELDAESLLKKMEGKE